MSSDPLAGLRAAALAGDPRAVAQLSDALARSGPIGARYVAGDGEGAWQALVDLGAAVRDPEHLAEARALAWETMRRVRRNLETLLARLDAIGYRRATPGGLAPPLSEDELDAIERALLGPLPLSLRAFWGVVGGVDLTQADDQIVHDWIDAPPDELACLGDDDPLVLPVPSVADFEHVGAGTPDDHGRHLVDLSPDRFGKAGVSGGPGYGLWLPDARADFRLYNDVCAPEEAGDEEHLGYLAQGQFFVRLLRDTMRGGGFRGPVDRESDELTPLPLRAVQRQLAEGLLPI
jgi:hypothetical protein